MFYHRKAVRAQLYYATPQTRKALKVNEIIGITRFYASERFLETERHARP
jgi:hypothetical protein